MLFYSILLSSFIYRLWIYSHGLDPVNPGRDWKQKTKMLYYIDIFLLDGMLWFILRAKCLSSLAKLIEVLLGLYRFITGLISIIWIFHIESPANKIILIKNHMNRNTVYALLCYICILKNKCSIMKIIIAIYFFMTNVI